MLTASLFSTLLATELPGPGTALVGQMLKFLKPVYVGEMITATVHVVSVNEDKRTIRLRASAGTSRGVCVEGELVVKVKRGLARSS